MIISDSLLGLMEAFDDLLKTVEQSDSNTKDDNKDTENKIEETNTESAKCDEKIPSEEFELTEDIYVVDDNVFLLTNSIKDILTTDNTELVFSHMTEDERYVAGITDEQLLLVLLYRNRNNKERYEQIKRLLN